MTEEDTDTVVSIQKNLGYFISYDNLFSTWLAKGSDFSVQDVRDALEETEQSLSSMIDDLEGSEFDLLGLAELKKLLGGSAK